MKRVLLVMLLSGAGLAVAQTPQAQPRQDRKLDGSLLNPMDEFNKRKEREAADKNFADLKADAVEMADLSKKISEDLEKGGRDVISARIFDRLDRIEKLVKKVRNAAKE